MVIKRCLYPFPVIPATMLGTSLLGYTGTVNGICQGKSNQRMRWEKRLQSSPSLKDINFEMLGYYMDFFDATTHRTSGGEIGYCYPMVFSFAHYLPLLDDARIHTW